MKVNFYWSGKNWQFVNRLTIVSHVSVGHEVVLWTHVKPKNEYWVRDVEEVDIRDANEYVNSADMLKKGWNTRTLSTLFQYKLMQKTGEYTADCDAVALKHWPDSEWCLVAEKERWVSSVGVLRVPAGHPVLTDAIKKANRKWGNVKIFSKCCQRHKLVSTYKPEEFYPTSPHPTSKIPHILKDADIPDAYSYHVFFNSAYKKGINHKMVDDPKYKNSLLRKLSLWALEGYGYTNDSNTT